MSIKNGLLALLRDGSSHGYRLKHAFEGRTGGTWQVNIGQVYTTLQRLERDGLVAEVPPDEQGRHAYAITDAGRAAADEWFAAPLDGTPPPRDELAIKVLLAAGSPDVDTSAVIQRQRRATTEQLQVLTREKRDIDPQRELARLLHLDARLLKGEAQLRWLDLCEQRLQAAGDTSSWPDADDDPDDPEDTDALREVADPDDQRDTNPAPPIHDRDLHGGHA